MIFREYENELDFMHENEFNLLIDEEINNTMLGIIPQTEKNKFFFRIENENKIEMIGLITRTERKGLIVYIKNSIIDIDVCEFLVEQIVARNIELKEIKAPKGIAEIIYDLYSKKVNVDLKSKRTVFLMKLKELKNIKEQNCMIRKANNSDLEYEKNVAIKIYKETFDIEIDENKATDVAKAFIEKGLYFLINENGEILSQAVTTKETKNGYTIGGVFTPENYRKKGYAKECLYRVIKIIKDENKDVVVLHTNVQKEHTRRLYEGLGFEIILEETFINF